MAKVIIIFTWKQGGFIHVIEGENERERCFKRHQASISK